MADGDDLVIGEMNTTSNSTTRLYQDPPGKASVVLEVKGGAYSSYGILGSGNNTGIRGTGGQVGVKGIGDIGVQGEADSGKGVVGVSDSSTGVEGSSDSGTGVEGSSDSGVGVQGSSVSDYGVVGDSQKSSGVRGSSDVFGVDGNSKHIGVIGSTESSWPWGLPTGVGVCGTSKDGQGVHGAAFGGVGVFGHSTNGIAVKAEANGVFPAVVASAPNAIAVNGDGVYGVRGASTTKSGIGVFGKCSDGYAGYFEGNVLVNGDLTKTGIGSTVAVRFPDRSYRQLYSIESPESWFEDFGEGRLVKGKAEVKIDPDFAKTVDLRKRYHVFVTPHSAKISGLAVVARLPGRFRVEHADGGSGTFSYRVVAKRADISVPRLKRMKMPDLDSIAKAERLITKGARGRVRARRKRSGGRRGSKRRS
jgi:hypothetical protein